MIAGVEKNLIRQCENKADDHDCGASRMWLKFPDSHRENRDLSPTEKGLKEGLNGLDVGNNVKNPHQIFPHKGLETKGAFLVYYT